MFTCPKLLKRLPFRVTMHDRAEAFELTVEGSLTAAGAPDVEARWRTAASIVSNRPFRVDLRSVDSVDPTGRELLARMRNEGAELVDPASEETRLNGFFLRNLPALIACLLSHLTNRSRPDRST